MIHNDSAPSSIISPAFSIRTVPGLSRNPLRSIGLLSLALFIVALAIISPASAGTQVMAGSPALSAHIAGTNEFSPGDDVY
ncbi:MAG TPA: hypothetical protein VMS83_06840, partial [Methanoregula sp.]|nr:hypothetical protein [Methanoregula sp.]